MIAWLCVAVVLTLAFVVFLCWSLENAMRHYDNWRRNNFDEE